MNERNRAIDITRGFAVMGILLMNVIAFSMPEPAYLNPNAWGGESIADRLIWALSFILIDGKMRGLFSLLFGASMLLLMDRTELQGGNGYHRHAARSFWLFLIGIAHYLLIWWGDILALYAMVGLVAMLFAGKQPMQLVKCAFLAFGIHLVIVTLLMIAIYHGHHVATAADANAHDVNRWNVALASMGHRGSEIIAEELAIYRGNWQGIIAHEMADFPGSMLSALIYMGFETLGFMLLGMAMLKSGLLEGKWRYDQYIGTARHCFIVGIPPTIGFAIWSWASGFDVVTTFGSVFAWSFPFRIPLTVGIATSILAIVTRAKPGRFLELVEAAGRMSLSNYLGTSLVMTTIFYGWGFGLFGSVSRAPVYLFVPPIWALMLLWSKPWLSHFRHGPAEWLWRSLTLGRLQPMKIVRAATQ